MTLINYRVKYILFIWKKRMAVYTTAIPHFANLFFKTY